MYPKFLSIEKCVKCNTPQTVEYSGMPPIDKFIYTYEQKSGKVKEHMRVQCSVCSYAWFEQCADFEQNDIISDAY